jgi:hypothetical protein
MNYISIEKGMELVYSAMERVQRAGRTSLWTIIKPRPCEARSMVGITLEKGYRICLIMSDDQAVDG